MSQELNQGTGNSKLHTLKRFFFITKIASLFQVLIGAYFICFDNLWY